MTTSSRILAIDPGTTESAYVLIGENAAISGGAPEAFGKGPNREMLDRISLYLDSRTQVVIEMVASYGMPVGAEVFETVAWIGRFMERCHVGGYMRLPAERLPRMSVKIALCHNSRANDGNIRQALIDRFGGKEVAIGKKASPGPLYGMSGDVWAALGVACAYADGARWEAVAA